jgi:hypothetical protein
MKRGETGEEFFARTLDPFIPPHLRAATTAALAALLLGRAVVSGLMMFMIWKIAARRSGHRQADEQVIPTHPLPTPTEKDAPLEKRCCCYNDRIAVRMRQLEP